MGQTRLLQKPTFGSEFCFKFAHLVNKENTENALPFIHLMSPPKAKMFDYENLGSTESKNFAGKSDIFYKISLTKARLRRPAYRKMLWQYPKLT